MAVSSMRGPKNKGLVGRLKERSFHFIFSSRGLPIFIFLIGLSVLFVFVRMKGVEQHYRYNEISAKVSELSIKNKELKAQKAKMLSIKKLRSFAKKYNLKEPRSSQIIMIP